MVWRRDSEAAAREAFPASICTNQRWPWWTIQFLVDPSVLVILTGRRPVLPSAWRVRMARSDSLAAQRAGLDSSSGESRFLVLARAVAWVRMTVETAEGWRRTTVSTRAAAFSG